MTTLWERWSCWCISSFFSSVITGVFHLPVFLEIFLSLLQTLSAYGLRVWIIIYSVIVLCHKWWQCSFAYKVKLTSDLKCWLRTRVRMHFNARCEHRYFRPLVRWSPRSDVNVRSEVAAFRRGHKQDTKSLHPSFEMWICYTGIQHSNEEWRNDFGCSVTLSHLAKNHSR